MTGNVVILGMGIAGVEGLPVAGPLVALIGYVLGAAVVGGFIRRRERSWSPFVTVTVVVNAVVFAAVATALLFVSHPGQSAAGIASAATIAVVMGAQASIARFLAVTEMTTVVVTSTITSYASETLFKGGLTRFTHRRLWAVVTLVCGLLGALPVGARGRYRVAGSVLITRPAAPRSPARPHRRGCAPPSTRGTTSWVRRTGSIRSPARLTHPS